MVQPLSKSDFTNICRCCLSTEEQRMASLNQWHVKIFCAITCLELRKEDMLPKLICEDCAVEMYRIKKFADVCKKSDARLQKINEEGEQEEVKTEDSVKIESAGDSGDLLNEEMYPEVSIKEDSALDDNSVESDHADNNLSDMDDNTPLLDLKKEAKHEKITSSKVTRSKRRKMNLEKRYRCDHCNKYYRSPSRLKEHMKAHLKRDEKLKIKPEKSLKIQLNTCYTCRTKFKSAALRNQHYEESGTCKPRQFNCEICSKTFNTRAKLKKHEVMHSDDRTFACSICNKTFKHWANWKWHEKNIHDKDGQMKHICNVCGKGFALPCHLKLHEETHTHSGSYICDLCGKTCTSKLQFRSHKQTHKRAMNQDFLCTDCGKVFGTKQNLVQHARQHTGEKPHQCPHCPKSFAQTASLQSHVNIHLGIRPYACDLCEKTFRQGQHLKAHKLSHSGAKPYECNICGNKFVSASNLRLHMLIHTGDTPLKCSHCDAGFADYKTRRAHVKQVHGIITTKGGLMEHDEAKQEMV